MPAETWPSERATAGHPVRVVIVGAGPRAVSVLDRLAVRLAAESTRRAVKVTLIDPFGPGGRIWRRDQPPELLMNTFAGESTIFADPSHGELGGFGPDLCTWAKEALNRSDPDLTEAEVAAARALGPHDYAPRFLFGAYVRRSCLDLLGRLPEGMEVVALEDSVVNVTDRGDGTQEVHTAAGRELAADAVVLATGHTDTALGPQESLLAEHARTVRATYGPPALPTESMAGEIPAGEDVVLRGMALNFFDLVAMLTEGRGGRFERDGSGDLRYRPSGQEPVIHAGSRRGIPSYSRIDTPGPSSEVSFLDNAVVRELLRRAPDVDLRRDVWPLVVKEASWIHYGRLGIEGLEDDFRRLTPETAEWDAMIARAVPDVAQRLDLNAMADPLGTRAFGRPEELDAWMIAHLERDLDESADPASPRSGVGAFLRVARGRVYPLMAGGGVSGQSYRRDAGWFHALLRNIGNGPPRVRTEQLAALARAGVVRFLGANLRIASDESGFVVSSASLPQTPLRTRHALDAFVPSPSLATSCDPLWIALRASGGARAYRRPDNSHTWTQTGAVEVEEPTSRVVLDSGPHPARFLVGAATEGIRWNTAMASRAGVRSRFVTEADAIAVCLTALTSLTALASPALPEADRAP